MKATLDSISENNGLGFLTEKDQKIYNVGISTGGLAEIRMARAQKDRHVTATTIDLEGAEYAKRSIEAAGLSNQVDVKIEDVCQPLPYPDNHFDYVYARLVLHYLPKDPLILTLAELYRVLRARGRLFVVVRSVYCPEARGKGAQFDPATCLTTYSSEDKSYSRYFHSQDSIKQYLLKAGFSIKAYDTYQERLCIDFQRRHPASQMDSLIEVLAAKWICLTIKH